MFCNHWDHYSEKLLIFWVRCIETGSGRCAQKVQVILPLEISTGLNCFQAGPGHKTGIQKSYNFLPLWSNFYRGRRDKIRLFWGWIQSNLSAPRWQGPFEPMIALSGIFFLLFSLRALHDGRKLFLWPSNCRRLPRINPPSSCPEFKGLIQTESRTVGGCGDQKVAELDLLSNWSAAVTSFFRTSLCLQISI